MSTLLGEVHCGVLLSLKGELPFGHNNVFGEKEESV